jgi:hypothetical protein
VIEFVGVVLHPLCFILEWAPGGSLKSIIEKYRKVDARISPMALQNTAYQVINDYYRESNLYILELLSMVSQGGVLIVKFISCNMYFNWH